MPHCITQRVLHTLLRVSVSTVFAPDGKLLPTVASTQLAHSVLSKVNLYPIVDVD
jgi:hypothetical protein